MLIETTADITTLTFDSGKVKSLNSNVSFRFFYDRKLALHQGTVDTQKILNTNSPHLVSRRETISRLITKMGRSLIDAFLLRIRTGYRGECRIE